MRSIKFIIYFLISLNYVLINAQNTTKSIKAKYITTSITIDGLFDEEWLTAEIGEEFVQYFPSDLAKAEYATSFKVLYNETTLYIGIKAHTSTKNYIVSSLKRDFRGPTNDNVSLLFDTFNDGINAYFFGVTPLGVQREGLVTDGGEEFDTTWDVKWHAESTTYDDFYIVEIAIPFTSIKFIEGTTRWRMRCYRWNLQNNEQTTWTQVPQNQDLASLAYMGELIFEKPLGKSKTPFALIPYLNSTTSKDYTVSNSETKIKIGGDAKVSIGNTMNLDMTVNPDFSNVEVDEIITNLTRFELQLPEKRQFFIDNNDLFSTFGDASNNTPFFSRRVGLARNTDGNLIENRILGGIRLSGKITPTWRLGFLNIQTDEDLENTISSYNNMMLSFQKKVFSRSNFGFFIVNKQTYQDHAFLNPDEKYNRVLGLDYNLASPNNIWRGKFFAHKSIQPGDSEDNISAQAKLLFDNKNWRIDTEFVYIDEEYSPDLGFVPRKDFFKSEQAVTRRFYPKSNGISNHTFSVSGANYWKPTVSYVNTDQEYSFGWKANFKNLAELVAEIQNNYILLQNDFDPTRTSGATPLPANTAYSFNQVMASYSSNPSKLFTYGLETTMGAFFNGNSFSVKGQIGFRFQPKVNVSLALNYDGIRLPEPYSNADIWLATANSEITFSKSLFWSTLLQYSNQRDNLGINSRLQWRFAPLSDLFLVYNDNYSTNPYAPQFRSLNLKLTYWLNM